MLPADLYSPGSDASGPRPVCQDSRLERGPVTRQCIVMLIMPLARRSSMMFLQLVLRAASCCTSSSQSQGLGSSSEIRMRCIALFPHYSFGSQGPPLTLQAAHVISFGTLRCYRPCCLHLAAQSWPYVSGIWSSPAGTWSPCSRSEMQSKGESATSPIHTQYIKIAWKSTSAAGAHWR